MSEPQSQKEEETKKKTVANIENGDGKAQQQEQLDKIREERDTLAQERDQLKINLYLLATNLKELGFQVSDQGNTIQRLGTDIVNKIRLTAEQTAMIQKQIRL